MKLAQEQMSRMPPEELARIQQQMMSNPDLMKLATDSMKNLRPEDVRRAAEQLKHAKPEEMAEISEKMANAKPEDIAAMKAHAEAQVSYALNAAKMLKQQGNELHSRGRYYEATNKYKLAKDNLKDIPTVKSGTLLLQCSANLMSCYLRTKQFDECIKEGSEVLSYDTKNVKALYRRGQAYRELGMLEAAVSDLEKAHEISPEDETIADVLRDATENLAKARKNGNVPHGLVIEEIVEEETRLPVSSSEEYSVTQPVEAGESSRSASGSRSVYPAADAEIIDSLKDNPDSIRLFQNYLANADPNSLAAMGGAGMPPDMVRTATEMINKMKPEELQKMLQLASSLNGNGGPMSNGSVLPSKIPEMSPEMLKMASDKMSKMSPEDIQKMVDIASSMNMNGSPFPGATTHESTQRSSNDSQPSVAGSSSTGISDLGESTSSGLFSNSRMDPSSSIPPGSTADMQENMRNSMKDPAMRQMLTSMMKNMSPEMMSNMSEQFGVKLSKEDAAKAQQAMSSLSPDDLDKMMRWAGRAQSGIETARKTKNWILGKPGMILAICMLILAFIFNRLGFIGS